METRNPKQTAEAMRALFDALGESDSGLKDELEQAFVDFKNLRRARAPGKPRQGHGGGPAQPCLTGIHIDLFTGDIYDRQGGNVVGKLDRWGQREGTIAAELYLARSIDAEGLHILEIAAIWPSWLEKATSFDDLLTPFHQVKWRFNVALSLYGLEMKKIAELTFGIVDINEHAPATCTVSAQDAATRLDAAQTAIQQGNPSAALVEALEAMQICPKSCAAHKAVGMICAAEGFAYESSDVLPSAEFLIRYEQGLRNAVNRISALWKTEENRKRWASAMDCRREFEEELRILVPVIEWAKQEINKEFE